MDSKICPSTVSLNTQIKKNIFSDDKFTFHTSQHHIKQTIDEMMNATLSERKLKTYRFCSSHFKCLDVPIEF